jgi:hypothetical protein
MALKQGLMWINISLAYVIESLPGACATPDALSLLFSALGCFRSCSAQK